MDLKILWTIASGMGTYSDLNMLKEAKGFNIDLVAADRVDKDSVGFLLTGKKYVIPKGDEPGYIESIMDICSEECITTILPQYSDELVPLCRNIDAFDDMGVKILVTRDAEKLDIANNKKKLYQYFKGRGFIPSHEFADNAEDLEKAVYDMGYPKLQVCVKPIDGEGGKGFKIISMDVESILKDQAGSPKISWKSYEDQIRQMEKLPELMVMEYLPGIEYSVDCVCMDGEAYICIPRERVETSMGIATVSVTRHNEELIELSKQIISELDLCYNVNLQFKYSSSGKPMLMEINPRVSGSLVANCGAGVNMLELSLKLAYGQALGSMNIDWDTMMVRYWDQLFVKEKGEGHTR